MIRFNFDLRPVGEIVPWTKGDGSDPRLGWFALSDGHYWITVDEVELFRYSEESVALWRSEGYEVASPYANYQVVRLWEDVLDWLPEFHEPVPEDLHAFVRGELIGVG